MEISGLDLTVTLEQPQMGTTLVNLIIISPQNGDEHSEFANS